MGVRISWLILARKELLARLAVAAVSSARFRSTTSSFSALLINPSLAGPLGDADLQLIAVFPQPFLGPFAAR